MKPNISEFSYGYALTESLINTVPLPMVAAPVFPSLIKEGSPGGGYDLQLPFGGLPLFLQFKLSHHMVRDTAQEAKKGLLHPPFYRMHLRPTKHSQQHPMLLALEATGAAVYYVTPYFHYASELNHAYLNGQIVARSLFLKPSEIGHLPDHDDHHVSFAFGCPIYMCSQEPRCIREQGKRERDFVENLQADYQRYEHSQHTDDSIRRWTAKLIKIIEDYRADIKGITDQSLYALKDRGSLSTLAYLARTFFECNVVILIPKKD